MLKHEGIPVKLMAGIPFCREIIHQEIKVKKTIILTLLLITALVANGCGNKKNVKDILIPSEEMKIQVYPMDYEEFCDATGGNYELLRQIYGTGSAIGQATNRKLMRDLRIYMALSLIHI